MNTCASKGDERALTVVFATYDRSAVLWQTLTHLSAVNRAGLDVEFVVVDNYGKDDTRAVIETFRDRLAIRYLHEPRAGKNRALNVALQHGGFRPVVVFTDDDVKPSADWLHAILQVCRRWPEHKVFGGKITPRFPIGDPPEWVRDELISQMAFAAHDLGPVERPYKSTEQPFGPNFWLRREVLTRDVRFDESVGPGTGSLGDEVMFLHNLQRGGFEIVYSPFVCVEHCIQPGGLSEEKLRERALMVGRIGPTMYGLCRPEVLSRMPLLWKLMRHVRLNQARLQLLRAELSRDPRQRIVGSISPLVNIGYNAESLRLAGKHAAAEAARVQSCGARAPYSGAITDDGPTR